MSDEKVVSFREADGSKVDYVVLDQVLICGSEYVAMAPVKEREHIELFKIKFDKDWNESLEEVESEKEINMFKQVSKIKM
ncbi:MAG: DUF1292 domain-containing protein [Clostridium baratii]|uniref:DUF1292 domain-containing protein n=1 Tax=Clostridium baratii str. Sullivan TaxID=1415775 RepID=A0A0A7FVJ2_9CLOT|nr:DUF1292 domain-containing protein [Clostridium baratii]AIY82796.1 hypothetical protein U729_2298 [Clostridium baratii str. Sullivan]MBS6006052.1 DUF1292 domain-containing protein [Clostridium baratii]MDU1053121.1 DUF1292 domain-containing protein [Clostridium baratii]MDU4911798.1 DUF1292 domain-containing protein [Clostridium baratii]CUP14829.1 Protein of uncharacterised function (DUF1292) [Clostridium baratii]